MMKQGNAMVLATEPTGGNMKANSSLRGDYVATRSKHSLNQSHDKNYHSPNFSRKVSQKPSSSNKSQKTGASARKGGNNKKKQTNHLLLQASMGTQKVSSFPNNQVTTVNVPISS